MAAALCLEKYEEAAISQEAEAGLLKAGALLRGRPKASEKRSSVDIKSITTMMDDFKAEQAMWRSEVAKFRGQKESKNSPRLLWHKRGSMSYDPSAESNGPSGSGGAGEWGDDTEPRDYFVLPEFSITGYKTHGRYIIHPNNPKKIVFDLAVGVLIVYSILAAPFRIAFDLMESPDLLVSDIVMDSIFGLDILVTFRTAYFDSDLFGYETNPYLIAKKYFRGFFLVDFISTVPFAALAAVNLAFIRGFGSMLRTVRIVRLVKLARLVRVLRIAKLGRLGVLSKPENDPGSLPMTWELSKMMAMLYFIAHVLGCFWHYTLDQKKEVRRMLFKALCPLPDTHLCFV